MTGLTESIVERLKFIEHEEAVAILLAVESGSRAWGFPSQDSDYDVRFLYVHPEEYYLSINLEERRDVIERPITEQLNLSGWDIRKALNLFRKSNPPLLEWLQCPLVYMEQSAFASQLRSLLPDFYSPKASFYHYLHMAQGNVREYLRGDTVWRKKYFYVLRPLLAMRWIEQGRGPVPIEFTTLLDATVDDIALRKAIDRLLAAKIAGKELDYGPRDATLSGFIERELARLEKRDTGQSVASPSIDRLNELFRSTIREVWHKRGPA